MNGAGFRSWPDRLFIRPKEKAFENFWVEFKRPGHFTTESQAQLHKHLAARGELVFVVHSLEEFKPIFKIVE